MAVWQADGDGEIGKTPVDMTLLLRRSVISTGSTTTAAKSCVMILETRNGRSST
jgi:hypothetical protein